MDKLSKLILWSFLAVLIGLPLLAGARGWGLGSQTNANVVANADPYCPANRQREDGSCVRTHRSYYVGRSHSGGGPRSGK